MRTPSRALILALLGLLVAALLGGPGGAEGGGAAADAQGAGAQPTLLLYNTVESLLAGDLLHTVALDEVAHHLAAFPPDWPAVGLGTTNWIGRNGELLPLGLVGALRYWWADPDPPTHAAILDLGDRSVTAALGAEPYLPFLGLAVGEPASARRLVLSGVDDVHAWLAERLAAEGIGVAGVRLEGAFGPVRTTVAYNIPLSGLDLSGGYVGDDYFRFGDYAPADWTIVGLYAGDPALHAAISTPGQPLHLHGYQPDTLLGGHVGHASARQVTATIYPVREIVARRGRLQGPKSAWRDRRPVGRASSVALLGPSFRAAAGSETERHSQAGHVDAPFAVPRELAGVP